MQRQSFLLAVVIVLVLASLAFVGWTILRTLPPAALPATPTLPATAAPVTAVPPQGAGGIIVTEFLTMTLPPGWLATPQPGAGDLPTDRMLATPLIIAWQGGATFDQSRARFTVVTVPRNDLSLAHYLVDVTEQFSATDGISGVTANLVTDLRADGLPVALIGYTMHTQAGDFDGRQAALFDTDAAQLVIATLAHRTDGTDVESLFRRLIETLRFPDASPSE